MPQSKYRSAADFRRALEDRLQDIAKKEAIDLQRVRREVAFDRLLIRLFRDVQSESPLFALKGGYAMELRISSARATKDIDLTAHISGHPDHVNRVLLQKLQECAAFDAGDFFLYLIAEPIADVDAAPYGGARFPVETRLDGRTFVKFHIDVGVGDAIMEPLEIVEGKEWLQFAGIPNPSIYMIPREQQFAKKLHAYTLPRAAGVNSRVRDLVDMVLLIRSDTMNRDQAIEALRLTFARRKTHRFPEVLSFPPSDWERPFEALAYECNLEMNLQGAFLLVNHYLSHLQL